MKQGFMFCGSEGKLNICINKWMMLYFSNDDGISHNSEYGRRDNALREYIFCSGM